MNRPEHQHYIPRSYLNKFAEVTREGKKFVEVYDFRAQTFYRRSTRGICVKTNLYTLSKEDTQDPYKIERFYADNVDQVYPEVFELLIDPKVTEVSKKQKRTIIYTLMSLYFRTPRFLKALNFMSDRNIDLSFWASDPAVEEINIDYLGKPFSFKRDEIHLAKKKMHEQNRMDFLTQHLKHWHDFVAYKYNSTISVYKIDSDIELITSDNPVIINNSQGQGFNLFDPSNMIKVPLDRKHCLIIYPNNQVNFDTRILRTEPQDRLFALTINMEIYKAAQELLIGYPGTCQKHFVDQKKYGEETPENLKAFDEFTNKAKLLTELVEVMELKGFFSEESKKLICECKKIDYIKNDNDFKEILEVFRKFNIELD